MSGLPGSASSITRGPLPLEITSIISERAVVSPAENAVSSADQFVPGVDHRGMPVSPDANHAVQPDLAAGLGAHDPGPAVEQGREVAGSIGDPPVQHGALAGRLDPRRQEPTLHSGVARFG